MANSGLNNSKKGILENPWMLATIFLAVVLIIVLVLRFTGAGLTGNVVSEDKAVQNLMDFVKAQGGGEAEYVSTSKNGSFYEITIKYQGQELPVYVTQDGKYLVPSLIPLAVDNSSAETNSKETPTEVTKSDKPKVEVFVMSLCPYGTQIEKGIIPVANLLGSKIDFSIKFVSYSMHGKTEIDENTRQYCIQQEQNSKFIKYLTCYLKEGKSDACLTEAAIDKTKLDACVKAADAQFNITAEFNAAADSGYPRYNVHAAENEQYGVEGSPTLVINGAQVSSGRDSASLLKAVCSAFNSAPAECGNSLSSTAPSPGFGETAGASGSGTASCS